MALRGGDPITVAAVHHDDRASYVRQKLKSKKDRWADYVLSLAGTAKRRVFHEDLHQLWIDQRAPAH